MKRWIAFAIVSFLLGYSIVAYGANKTYAVASQPPTVNQLLRQTNAERAKVGVPPLKLDIRLNHSAQLKAEDERNNHYFGHVNPKTGMNGYEYISPQKIPGCRGSENLTENVYVNDAATAINAFMNSRPHREAMLNPHAFLVGFGISGDQIVQHFCMDY